MGLADGAKHGRRPWRFEPYQVWAMLDPAAASAPLVTTLADAAGVFIDFGVATAILFPA